MRARLPVFLRDLPGLFLARPHERFQILPAIVDDQPQPIAPLEMPAQVGKRTPVALELRRHQFDLHLPPQRPRRAGQCPQRHRGIRRIEQPVERTPAGAHPARKSGLRDPSILHQPLELPRDDALLRTRLLRSMGRGLGSGLALSFRFRLGEGCCPGLLPRGLQGGLGCMKPLFCQCLRLSFGSSLGLPRHTSLSPPDLQLGPDTLQACLSPSLDFGLALNCRLRLGLGCYRGLLSRGLQGLLGLVQPL